MPEEPLIAKISMFAGNFAPRDWAFCDGQLLAISSNSALFSLLGVVYGGDGRTTFGLPDLRGRLPLHQGAGPGLTNRQIGSKPGTEDVAITEAQMPSHTHELSATIEQADPGASGGDDPTGRVLAFASINIYRADPVDSDFDASAVTDTGGGQGHDNIMPFLCVNFIIALTGVFPSRT